MKLTIESTAKIVTLNGVPARIWEGHTETGYPVHVYVTRVASDNAHANAELDRALQESRAPSPEIGAIPMRLIL